MGTLPLLSIVLAVSLLLGFGELMELGLTIYALANAMRASMQHQEELGILGKYRNKSLGIYYSHVV